MWYLPNQKVSKATRESVEWKENTVKHFTSFASFYSNDKWLQISLYRAAQGILDKEAYKYVLNPYNSTTENKRNFPAQMRNIDIISPIIKLYLGEKAERPDVSTVVCVNSDSPRQFQEELNKEIEGILAQSMINELNKLGVQTGVDSQEVPEIPQYIREKTTSYVDKRGIMGQEALDYLSYDLNLKDKRQTAFRDWVINNRVYSFKYIANNDVKHDIISCIEMYNGSTPTGMVEDAPWAIRKRKMFAGEVLDLLNKKLSDEDVEWLESKMRYDNTATTSIISQTLNIDTRGDNRETNSYIETGLIDVSHLNWKCFQKYGILKYVDEFDQEQEIFVDETYSVDKENGDIEIEWLWGNLVMEAYQIEDRVIINTVQPIEVQRNEINNYSTCKLAYNGKIDLTPSPVQILLDYQVLINIYHFRRELTLARNKDKILVMPKGILGKMQPDKFMYYAEATGVAWVDETAPGFTNAIQAIKAIDMGLGNYLNEMTSLIREIKEEAWDAVGMNRQRYGDINSSDGKGVNDQAVFRSSTITREQFRKFEKFTESDDQGLLDYSKAAWKDGKKGSYVKSDATVALLNVDPDQHNENLYGVFAKDSAEEFQRLKDMKQIAGTFAQKGVVRPSTIGEILRANNISKLNQYMKKAEEIEDKMKQQSEQATLQSEEKVSQMNNETKKLESDTKLQIVNIQSQTALAIADKKIQGEFALESLSSKNEDGETNPVDNISELRKERLNQDKNNLNARKEDTNARLEEEKLRQKDRELDIKEKAAKNRNSNK